MKNKKWFLPTICLAMILMVFCVGILIWQHTAFDGKPFGYRCSITSVFYAVDEVPVVSPETAVFGLSDSGKLFDISQDGARLSGSMRKMVLSEENFDRRFEKSDAWRVVGLDAESARQLNAQAWKYTALDGRFYYLLLQENGDVFLCVGKNKVIEQFMWLQPLDQF